MNAIELMIFLGHSSTHEPFDEFLTKNGIKSRPKIGRSLETLITIKGQGLSMSFEIDAKGNGIAPKAKVHSYLVNLKFEYLEITEGMEFTPDIYLMV